MTLHMLKLCVGADSVDDLKAWVKKRAQANKIAGAGYVHEHVTRMFPRRTAELLDGGSIYWVIKGVVVVRQKLLGFEKRLGNDGIERCAIKIAPPLIATVPQPRRAFQGWRYLKREDAPDDLGKKTGKEPPPELAIELAELGLL